MAKTKIFHLYDKAFDKDGVGHMVTVVGKLVQSYKPLEVETDMDVEVRPGSIVKGKLKFSKKTLHRELSVGLAICHPTDKFDEAEGVRIALGRINRGDDIGKVETRSVTMLTDDLVMAELFGKLHYIKENIDAYLPD